MSGDYRRLLQELAVPRLVGSPEHSRVREVLKRELQARDYVVLEHPFPVNRSAGPNRLVPIGGALSGAALGIAVPSGLAPLVAAALAALVLGVAAALLVRVGAAPATGVNLIGVRPRTRVSLWLAAHYDSKGQPLSMALRIVAVVLAAVGVAGLVGIGAARLGGVPWSRLTELVAPAPALIGGLLLLGNRVTNRSPGAVDNATALVTVLSIIDGLPQGAAVGVLFPDAEEYGMLGAQALVRERRNLLEGSVVLNFDGIDDRGRVICFTHRSGATIAAVAAALGVRERRVLPVVVDGLAFASAAAECATIMRGDWRTACLVHTPLDTAERLTLSGSAEVARLLARALTSREDRPSF